MISSVAWVPRGMARANPVQFEPTEEELDYARQQASYMKNEAVEDDSDKDEEDEVLDSQEVQVDELGPEFNMDTYDDDDEVPSEIMMEDDEVDPNFTVSMDGLDSDEEEDTTIQPTDAILLAAHAEDDYSCLEVYVYDSKKGSLYVHHDIALPAFPLTLAWTGYAPYTSIEQGSSSSSSSSGGSGGSGNITSGNFVAVGTFEPGIEIWNLDVMEALTPVAILGGRESMEEAEERQKKKKKKKKSKKGRSNKPLLPSLRNGSHKDAVLGLSWNQQQSHILASGSADNVVKIWDLQTCQCLASFNHHKDKVQAVQWHPLERTVLATGSYDGTVKVLDVRSPDNVTAFPTSADIECLEWNPHNPASFAVSSEDGNVTLYDARQNSSALFTLHASEKSVSSISFNKLVSSVTIYCCYRSYLLYTCIY
jgi:periodic tryptophan protein 1